MLNIRRLAPAEFFAATVGGWPCGLRLERYEGCGFFCACGEVHAFQRSAVPVLRQLPGRRLVLACPGGLPFVTCVALRGLLRTRGFQSLFGAELVANGSDEPHQILGIDAATSPAEVRLAYLDLVKVWHPDRFDGDARLQARAEAQLKAINAAYDQLQGGAPRRAARPAPAASARPAPVSHDLPLTKFRFNQSAG